LSAAAGILSGLRVIEVSAFVAAPLGGATLAALGADVIRVDPIGGGIDSRRWPLHGGRSLYWAGLNQGKRSVTMDTRSDEGRRLLADLVAAPGEGGGIVLTNLPATGWMSYERLAERRPDLIMLVITGNPDGSSAVDYTVNAALGFPWITGPADEPGPVNHVLPAWDALTGYLAVAGILAAERHRSRTGEGQLVELSLADVGLALAGHLGFIAEAELEPEPRGRYGNYVYGTFGRDFASADGRHLIVIALTPRQWQSLLQATDLGAAMAEIEAQRGFDLRQEAARWAAREEIAGLLEAWIEQRDLSTVAAAFNAEQVLWGPYQTFQELVRSDPRCSPANPIVARAAGGDIGDHLLVGSPLRFGRVPALSPQSGPGLGEHTGEVLASLAGLDVAALEALRARGLIG
jgi:2-methylfumaryl-CoA isomerase